MAEYFSKFATIIPMSEEKAGELCEILHDAIESEEYDDYSGFDYYAVGDGFYIYGDDFIDDYFLDLITKFIGDNFPDMKHTFGVAQTCSKPRPEEGAFGGFYVRLRANTFDIAEPIFR